MKLKGIRKIKGKIRLLSGLHIGAGDTDIHIGGTDNPVIKHPITKEPYIPGSSLKGKIRSLLELKSGLVVEGKPLTLKDILEQKPPEEKLRYGVRIIKAFGTSGADEEAKKELGPTRISFSDCYITEEIREEVKKGKKILTEIKAENFVNRITGTAENPRFTERVPADIEFEFYITLKEFEGDEEDDLLDLLLEGMKLLEYDALGGNGSRGYGRVKFKFYDPELQKRFKTVKVFG